MAAWYDFFKLFAYAYFRPRNKDMPSTSVTGVGSTKQMLAALAESSKCRTVLFVDVDTEEEAQACIRRELMYSFDYIITRSGKVIKSRDGALPPVVPRDPNPAPKSKYRSIDDS